MNEILQGIKNSTENSMAGIQQFFFVNECAKHILCNTHNLTRRHDVTMDRGEYDLIFRNGQPMPYQGFFIHIKR